MVQHSTVLSGTQTAMKAITITKLLPYSDIPFVDLSNDVNGNRFGLTSCRTDSSGRAFPLHF